MTPHPSLDPDLAAAADGLPVLDLSDVTQLRALAERMPGPGPSYDGVEVRTVTVPGPDAAPDVPVRLLRPIGVPDALPILVAMHGGGFVLGSAADFDYFCVEVVRRLGIAVANVEYRLAPETTYPGPLEDCLAALRFVHEQAGSLAVDATRVAVGGSSAGGGLAAALALRARDEGGPAIAFQLLLSPAIDDDLDAPSVTDLVGAPVLSGPSLGLGWRHYLGADYAGPHDPAVPSHAIPARAARLDGLPPAYVAAMEVDPLRDGQIRYSQRMLQAGVRVELHVHPGAFHGSVELVPQAASSARILDGLVGALGRGLRVV